MIHTPDDHGRIELDKFHTPEATRTGPEKAPVNEFGIRRIMFVGEVVQYEVAYRLAYIRSPEGIIVGLSEQLKEFGAKEKSK